VTFGLVFIICAIGFKLSAAPFHMWTPDVYEGSPAPVTALFAIVPKLAAIALLLRLLFEPLNALLFDAQQIIVVLSVASLLVGSFAAIAQTSIKRFLAYSSIGHIGYALIGVSASSQTCITAVLVHMTIYMIMTAGFFIGVFALRSDGRVIDRISDLSGLSNYSPTLAYGMAIFLFSMAGLPPMAGFFGKFLVFKAAVDSGMMFLAVVGVLASVVSAFYYLRIVKVMFFDEPVNVVQKDLSIAQGLVMFACAVFVLSFIFNPSYLLDSAGMAAEALFNG
jgi:NADH-quinone oxidoreductase subunit N